jgi:cephalosporin hydroxylase
VTLPLAAWYQRNADDAESDIAPHFPTFARLMAEHDVRWIIELGVRDGASTSCWVKCAAQASGHVWSVDIEPTQLVPRRQWTFIHGDDLDPRVLIQLPPLVDLVFIDTSHAYEHTLRELDAYGPRVRAGGVIVLHDTENEHPEDHGELIGPQDPFPVRRAMVEWADRHDFRWSNDPQSWGLGVIYV